MLPNWVVALATRAAAACWALYFYFGALDLFIGLFRLHPYATGDGALIVPWLSLPLAASTGIAGAYAVWRSPPDRIGVHVNSRLRVGRSLALCRSSRRSDQSPSKRPSLVAPYFRAPLIACGQFGGWQRARTSSTSVGGIPKTMLGLLRRPPSVLAACGAVSGCMKAFRDGFDGWAGVSLLPWSVL